MKKSQIHEIIGCLYAQGRHDLIATLDPAHLDSTNKEMNFKSLVRNAQRQVIKDKEAIERCKDLEEKNEYAKASVDIDAVVERIEKATEANHHTESWIILCEEVIKNKKLTEAFKAIETLNFYFDGLRSGAKALREELEGHAKAQAKQKLSPEDFKKVMKAF